MSYEDAENIDLKILCPYCSAPYTAKMLTEYDIASGSEQTGSWVDQETVEIYCSNCKKLVYKKNS